jgi:diaminobutyrate-2-oxoglutarate transaminase
MPPPTGSPAGEDVFASRESEVRSYCRGWPAVFDRALGSTLWDEHGRPYRDFFSGAGALNYGHNNPVLKAALLDYLGHDGLTHGLDMTTAAKRAFLERLRDLVLVPRGLDHKVMFTGPTGTNAVEAALKLARRVTGRDTVVAFTNAFHGVSLGSLAVTGDGFRRSAAGVPLPHVARMPYDGYLGEAVPGLPLLERMLADPGSGLDHPAAVIVETVQGEGGMNVARAGWLRALSALCRRHGVLLIVDDVQMGCGRTGGFFSFEEAGITPDLVVLSKSVSGYGLPMALLLIRPDLDVWRPGEHNGTFRGNNLAFVTATAALGHYWADSTLEQATRDAAERLVTALDAICAADAGAGTTHRGRGLAHGLHFTDPGRAARVCARAFDLGLLVETAGPRSEVVKLLPALTVPPGELDEGLALLAHAVATTP